MLERFKEVLLCHFSIAENIPSSPPLLSFTNQWVQEETLWLWWSFAVRGLTWTMLSCVQHVQTACASYAARLSIQCSSCLNFIKSSNTLLHLLRCLRASLPCHRLAAMLSWSLWAVWNEFLGNLFDSKPPQCWLHWLNESLDQRDHRETAFTNNNRSKEVDV